MQSQSPRAVKVDKFFKTSPLRFAFLVAKFHRRFARATCLQKSITLPVTGSLFWLRISGQRFHPVDTGAVWFKLDACNDSQTSDSLLPNTDSENIYRTDGVFCLDFLQISTEIPFVQ